MKKLKFVNEKSDFLTMINVYYDWVAIQGQQKRKWCRENFINNKSMGTVDALLKEIRGVVKHAMDKSIPGQFQSYRFSLLKSIQFSSF